MDLFEYYTVFIYLFLSVYTSLSDLESIKLLRVILKRNIVTTNIYPMNK